MDQSIFMEEIDLIENFFPKYKAWTKEPQRLAYRKGLWQAVKGYSNESLREVRLQVSDGEFGEDMPAMPRIVRACREYDQAQKSQPAQPKKFPRAEHECAKEKAKPCRAFDLLAVVLPYEAEHVLCQGKIPATCPKCGKKYFDKTVIDSLLKLNATGTENWNHYFKGWMLCDQCSKESEK